MHFDWIEIVLLIANAVVSVLTNIKVHKNGNGSGG